MLELIKIYADFQKLDDEGRLILSSYGTLQDLERNNLKLTEGLVLTFYTDDADDYGNPDDLMVEGIVQYNEVLNQWVAAINWNDIKHSSDYWRTH